MTFIELTGVITINNAPQPTFIDIEDISYVAGHREGGSYIYFKQSERFTIVQETTVEVAEIMRDVAHAHHLNQTKRVSP